MPRAALTDRMQPFSTTVFAEMSALAVRTGAINLGQGFPDTDGPESLLEDAVRAIRGGANQYPPGPGVPALREAVAAHLAKRRANGGDPLAARRTPEIAAGLGLDVLNVGARFEDESPPHRFAAYLARSVPDHAAAAHDWPTHPGALYSIAWVQLVARKPAADGL